jgi:hypothetical protein
LLQPLAERKKCCFSLFCTFFSIILQLDGDC